MIGTGIEKRIQVQQIIESQLPEFILAESPKTVDFLKQYYRSQEYRGGTIDIADNLDQYLKLDNLTPEVIVGVTTLSSGITYTSDTITDGWDSLTSIFDFEWSDLLPSWDWLDIIPGSLSDFFSLENLEMIWDGIGNLFSIAVQPIKDGVNFMTGVINDLIEYEFDYFFGSFSLSDAGVPTIPKLAKGGIVNKPTTAIIGEDGPEAVIPLTQRNNPQGIGLGGSTFNITVNAGGITDRTDKRSLAREIGNMI